MSISAAAFKLRALFFLTLFSFCSNVGWSRCRSAIAGTTLGRNDTQLRNFLAEVIKTYKPGKGLTENRKHVRRMVSWVRANHDAIRAEGVDPAILETGIYVSDMAKNPELLKKYQDEYGGDFLKAMLDHSRHGLVEADLIRSKESTQISDAQWEQIKEVVIGHDGPSLPGTWWHTNFSDKTGEQYPEITPGSKPAFIHTLMDRLDQGGVYRDAKGVYQGGLRKISFDELKFKNGSVAQAITHVFTKTHDGSKLQVGNLIDRVQVKGEFFPSKKIPGFLEALKQDFQLAPNIFQKLQIDGETIQYKGANGSKIQLKKLEDGNYRIESTSEGQEQADFTSTLPPAEALSYFWENL